MRLKVPRGASRTVRLFLSNNHRIIVGNFIQLSIYQENRINEKTGKSVEATGYESCEEPSTNSLSMLIMSDNNDFSSFFRYASILGKRRSAALVAIPRITNLVRTSKRSTISSIVNHRRSVGNLFFSRRVV